VALNTISLQLKPVIGSGLDMQHVVMAHKYVTGMGVVVPNSSILLLWLCKSMKCINDDLMLFLCLIVSDFQKTY